MGKINLDDYFQTSDWENKGKPLDSPEDIARAEEINQYTRKVVRDYRYRAAKSRWLARGLILDRGR